MSILCVTCAPQRPWLNRDRVRDYDRIVFRLIRYVVPEQEVMDYGQLWQIGGDSLGTLIDEFWADRDPYPDTEFNEYRNLLEARLTTTWDSLLSGLTAEPDHRIIPRVFHGLPTRTSTIRMGREDAQVIWFYEPVTPINEEVLEYPLLQNLTYAFLFTRDRLGHHRSDMESPNPHPPLPHLSESDIDELAAIIQDPSLSEALRSACVWRLRADPGHLALRALLESASVVEEPILTAIRSAINPLQVANSDVTGGMVVVPAALDSTRLDTHRLFDREMMARIRARALRRELYAGEIDSLYLAQMLTQPYQPSEELPDEVVDRLKQIAEEERGVVSSRGWLSSEAADSIFVGPLADARMMLDGEDPLAVHHFLVPLLRGRYRTNAEAWNLDALAMLLSGEPGGREIAEQSARQALRLDPGNLRYALTLAEVQLQRTFDRYGDRSLDRLLAETPSLADAYALKGKLRLEYVWNIGWRAGGWGTPIQGMSASRTENIEEALVYLNSALVLDPDNKFASWWLGMHTILTGRWVEVIRVMDYFIDQGAHLAEAYLARGLAYQSIGLFDEAMDDYQQGISLLPERVSTIADDPRWTLPISEGGINIEGSVRIEPLSDRRTGREVEELRRSTSGQDQDLNRDIFWRAKDPLFGTDLNERLIEQYRRFAHITWHYAVPYLGLNGWDTHRGRIYLRFGEPLTTAEVDRRRIWGGMPQVDVPQELALSGGTGGYGLVHREYWYYDGFRIPLDIGMLTGNRTLPHLDAYKELVEVIPESPRVKGYREIFTMEMLDMGFRWYRFENRAGGTELYMHTQFPKPRLVGIAGDTLRSFSAEIMLLNNEWQPLIHLTRDLPTWIFMHDRSLPLVTGPFVLEQEWVTGDPLYGAFEMMPPGPGPVYAGRDTIHFTDQGVLRLSSIVVAEAIRDVSAADDFFPGTFFTRGDQALIPVLDDRFHFDRPLLLYYEIYGLEMDEFNQNSYQLAIESEAVSEDTPSPIIEALGRLVGQESREGTVRLTFNRTGIGTIALEQNWITFNTEDPADRYRITIEITDLNSDYQVSDTVILIPYVDPYRLEREPPPHF